jgi:hypothetical protein
LARTALARIDNCEALLSRGPERIEATAEQALYAMARLGQMEDASRLAAKLGWADPKPVWETLQAVSSLVQKERLGEAVRLAQALEAEDLMGLPRFGGQVDYAASRRECRWICSSYSTGVR